MVVHARQDHARRTYTIDGGVDKALAVNAAPVVIAEPSDNAGGGAPPTTPASCAELIVRNVDNVALGPIWDPMAVRLCFDAGDGATFPLRFGGKTGRHSGLPVDARWR